MMKIILKDPYITILKSQLQKTLDAIKGKNQSAAIKTVEQFDVIFLWIWQYWCVKISGRVDCLFVFSTLEKFEYGDKFIHMIKVASTSVQSKIKKNPLSMLLYIIAAEALVNFIYKD